MLKEEESVILENIDHVKKSSHAITQERSKLENEASCLFEVMCSALHRPCRICA
jgi:hypothetical protein